MKKFSYILTSYLVKKNVIDSNKIEVYRYGFEIGLEVCLNTIISIFIALLCNMIYETIVFFVIFILLRSYAGGLHLKTYIGCLICSCFSLFGLLMVVKFWAAGVEYSIEYLIISLLFIKLLSPVQSVNRPINSKEMRIFRKKLNYTIFLILAVSVFFYNMHLESLLLMVLVTSYFMVAILVLGKIDYKKNLKKKTISNIKI